MAGDHRPLADPIGTSPIRAAKKISFKLFQEAELHRLIAWLHEPHVSAWWKPGNPAEIRGKYLPRLRGETAMRVFAIVFNSEPVGIVQAYPVDSGIGYSVCGIDLLIGDRSLIGRGFGPQVIRKFVTDEVFGHLRFAVCLADPDTANHRSTRAFEKAGFVHQRFAEDGGRTASIMAKLAPSSKPPECVFRRNKNGSDIDMTMPPMCSGAQPAPLFRVTKSDHRARRPA